MRKSFLFAAIGFIACSAIAQFHLDLDNAQECLHKESQVHEGFDSSIQKKYHALYESAICYARGKNFLQSGERLAEMVAIDPADWRVNSARLIVTFVVAHELDGDIPVSQRFYEEDWRGILRKKPKCLKQIYDEIISSGSAKEALLESCKFDSDQSVLELINDSDLVAKVIENSLLLER